MEHWSIIKNTNPDIVDIDSVDTHQIVRDQKNRERICIYAYRAGHLVGVIGRREINETEIDGKLRINGNYVYINQSASGLDEAKKVFSDNPQIWNIPVIDINGSVIFEYKKSFDVYYSNCDISNGLNSFPREKRIIVSLTSHGLRLKTVYIAIKSIMIQTVKADEIVLYLDDKSGDLRIDHEDELINAGLKIVRGVENLKPHCKYYYAFQDYPDDIVITVDDDIIYPDNLIEDLFNAHERYPYAVIAHRAHKAFDDHGNELLVKDFEWEVSSNKPEKFLCATGVGGVLYPPGNYRNSFLNANLIKRLSLNADDIWLMYMEAMTQTKVLALSPYPMRTICGSQEEGGLSLKNNLEEENQKWLNNIERYYGKTLKQLVYEPITCL